MRLSKEKLYNCYSLNLFHFLKEKGFYYIAKGLNENSGRNYWVFEKTESFKEVLDKWDRIKSSSK